MTALAVSMLEPPPKERALTVLFELLAVLAVYALALAFIRPSGNFPLDDDTYFGLPAIEFARKLWDLRSAQSQKIGESQLGRIELLLPDKGGTNSATVGRSGMFGCRLAPVVASARSLPALTSGVAVDIAVNM